MEDKPPNLPFYINTTWPVCSLVEEKSHNVANQSRVSVNKQSAYFPTMFLTSLSGIDAEKLLCQEISVLIFIQAGGKWCR